MIQTFRKGKKMGMTIDEAIQRYKNNAEYERTHGNLQGCLEFRQLAKWLEELRAYRNMYHANNIDNCLRDEVWKMGTTIEQCENCTKDWTKCGACPVMIKWVKEHRKEHKHE